MVTCPECGIEHGDKDPHLPRAKGPGVRICLVRPEHCSHPFGARYAIPGPTGPWIVCLTCGQFDEATPTVVHAKPAVEVTQADYDPPCAAGDPACDGSCDYCRPAAPKPLPAAGVEVVAPVQVAKPPEPAPVAAAPAGVLIRVLQDIPPFVDAELKTLELRAGDVVTLSPPIAQLLVRRGKAAAVEVAAA
jgi:hypothetical protein